MIEPKLPLNVNVCFNDEPTKDLLNLFIGSGSIL